MCIHRYTHTQLHICTQTYIHAYLHTCKRYYVCMQQYITACLRMLHTNMYTYINAYIHRRAYIYRYTHTQLHICTQTYVHAYLHTCFLTYLHTYSRYLNNSVKCCDWYCEGGCWLPSGSCSGSALTRMKTFNISFRFCLIMGYVFGPVRQDQTDRV